MTYAVYVGAAVVAVGAIAALNVPGRRRAAAESARVAEDLPELSAHDQVVASVRAVDGCPAEKGSGVLSPV